MEIRLATISDAEAIRRIYEPYVMNTAVSFEYEVPSVEEFEKRIQNTLKQYPYLVAVEDGEIVGYVYAGAFHSRIAYQHCVEISIYLDMNKRRKGYGSILYRKMEELLLAQNVYSVHACIASPDEEDEHLTNDSELFHERMGYELVGRHKRCGYKLGKWYSIVWMDKELIKRPEKAEDFIPFSQLTVPVNL